jgi:hypothetical protein
VENRRRFVRHQVEKEGQYYMDESRSSLERCTIIDVTREGMGIRFHTDGNISAGSTVHLEIPVLTELAPVKVEGIVKWVAQRGDDFTGGIKMTDLKNGRRE